MVWEKEVDWFLDAVTGPPLKGKRTRSCKAIDGGAELEAVLASDTALLMAVQSWKQRQPSPDAGI
jgi:hypothetical protein